MKGLLTIGLAAVLGLATVAMAGDRVRDRVRDPNCPRQYEQARNGNGGQQASAIRQRRYEQCHRG